MGECKESSVGAQSTLRGPMILAKVITDALENKKQVRELVQKYAINVHKYTCLYVQYCVVYVGREFRLWRGNRAPVCLSDEG